jgi:hypothetical protein
MVVAGSGVTGAVRASRYAVGTRRARTPEPAGSAQDVTGRCTGPCGAVRRRPDPENPRR